MKQTWLFAALLSALALGNASPASAGGYDTPILYSARHIGMGGTANAYVDDPSAIFHNPAGLQGTKKFAATLNVSPVFGKISATPNDPNRYPEAKDISSSYAFAPFFLGGLAYRVHDMVTLGLGVYPVASAGAEFEYKDPFGDKFEDRTKLVFIEAAPAISVQLPANVTLGASYRITYVDLERVQGGQNKVLDFHMTGINWLGFKLGLQWKPIEGLKLGAMYRHKTVTTIENDKGIALTANYEDISTKFTLPSRFVVGARYDFAAFPLGIASDIEYALNSQNTTAPFKGTDAATGEKASVPNVFRWTDALTVRVGAEYRLVDKHLPIRIGGAWDQQTSNPKYPTAFGTPPGDTWIATAGAGWVEDWWQVNLAGAYRTGEGKPTIDNANHNVCAFCGYTGDEPYKIEMFGLYVDGSVNFD